MPQCRGWSLHAVCENRALNIHASTTVHLHSAATLHYGSPYLVRPGTLSHLAFAFQCPASHRMHSCVVCSAYLTRLGTLKHRAYVAGDWTLTLLFGRDISRW